jgi:5-methylcytosine-specific restriction endonuclease McrA
LGRVCQSIGDCDWQPETSHPVFDEDSGEWGYIEKPTRFTLTVAHLDHNPANCDRANLKALCAPCHLRYDAPLHRANAAKTRAAKREKRDQTIGQLSLIDELCRPSPLTPLD